MKKIFTLLFCVAGMTFAANAATDLTTVQQCINALLVQDQNAKSTTAPVMDPNQDGVLSIADVTYLIQKLLDEEQKTQAKNKDIKKLINKVIVSDGDPNINDVTDAINEKLKNQKE